MTDEPPFLTPAKLEQLSVRVCQGEGLSREESLDLIQFIYALTGSGITCWQPVPLPIKEWVLISNGESITPPMQFSGEIEAEFFRKANESEYYLPIPVPPNFRAKSA